MPDASVSPVGIDMDKVELAVGFGYQFERVRMDFSYARVLADDRNVTALASGQSHHTNFCKRTL